MELSTVMKLGIFLLVCISSFCIHCTDAFDSFDPEGKISIKWDVRSWTLDGYIADVTIFNLQKYRHIEDPGWTLGWTWAKKEVIWTMMGALTTDQGDCSRFRGDPLPHCCKKNPSVVDMLPDTPYNKQVPNCCKGGVLSSQLQAQDPSMAASSFRITVGQTGTTNTTVNKPENFTLTTPGLGYTCGETKAVELSKFPAEGDSRRATQALVTWNATCTYSQYLSQQTPSCCVSLSAFYNDAITLCKTCSCGCRSSSNQPVSCIGRGTDSAHISSAISSSDKNSVLCTSHMCPIRVHWHIMENYKEYWRVKITISNFNFKWNYSQWNLVMQHPNFNDVAQIFSFNYKPLNVYPTINDTGMLFGIFHYNELLERYGLSGDVGSVQSDLIFHKNKSTFTFEQGWGFPREVYFNGHSCVMPSPETYPYLPNSGVPAELHRMITMIMLLVLAYVLV